MPECPGVVRHRLVLDRFFPGAAALRAHFDERFAAPRQADEGRFVWDLWNVPGQYTALRTPAWQYFPPRAYDAFHQHLARWGRQVLGCHDVSPPWLSCYVSGCEQRLHADVPHGPWAFVFSLTDWAHRRFQGGETLILSDRVLDYWRVFQPAAPAEESGLFEVVEPRFNRLAVFDSRVPHLVRRVDGTMDPREGRLVIHGWFLQPRPFFEGPLTERDVGGAIDGLSHKVAEALKAGLGILGVLSFRVDIRPSGTVAAVTLLADSTRSPGEEESGRKALIRDIHKLLSSWRFPPRRKPTRLTLPLVFEV